MRLPHSVAACDASLSILAYLLHTKNLGLIYTRHEPEILAYSDASWNHVLIPIGGRGYLWGSDCLLLVARGQERAEVVRGERNRRLRHRQQALRCASSAPR